MSLRLRMISLFFTFLILLGTSLASSAAIIEFHFTGQFTAVDSTGGVFPTQSPIESTFKYDSNTGFGSAELFIAPFTFYGLDITLSSISMKRIGSSNLILGNMLGAYRNNTGIDESGVPVSMIWDATGLFNAIDYGLQTGDVISGSNLLRNGNFIYNVNSANPATNGYAYSNGVILNQGLAPLAMTTFNTSTLCSLGGPGNILYTRTCLGLAISGGADYSDDGIAGSPLIGGQFKNININLDIGSGNSLTVLNVSTVPLPATIWLFSTGLISLAYAVRLKKFKHH